MKSPSAANSAASSSSLTTQAVVAAATLGQTSPPKEPVLSAAALVGSMDTKSVTASDPGESSHDSYSYSFPSSCFAGSSGGHADGTSPEPAKTSDSASHASAAAQGNKLAKRTALPQLPAPAPAVASATAARTGVTQTSGGHSAYQNSNWGFPTLPRRRDECPSTPLQLIRCAQTNLEHFDSEDKFLKTAAIIAAVVGGLAFASSIIGAPLGYALTKAFNGGTPDTVGAMIPHSAATGALAALGGGVVSGLAGSWSWYGEISGFRVKLFALSLLATFALAPAGGARLLGIAFPWLYTTSSVLGIAAIMFFFKVAAWIEYMYESDAR